jgi:predicted nucleotidyltransferase
VPRQEAKLAALTAFAEHAAAILREDERIRILWLTGSLAAGTADAQSDVDLRAAVRPEDFATLEQWWPQMLDQLAPIVWRRRWPAPPQEAIISAISTDYLRFDLVLQSARLLFDKDGLAGRIALTAPAPQHPLAHLSDVVEEFIRLVGMLPIVVERDDLAIGMEGHFALHSLLISLLLMENGIDRASTSKRHVAAFLTAEQRALLAGVPPLAPTMTSVIEARLAYARLFLPRARRLMAAHDLTYPAAFEAATKHHLAETLHLSL